MIELFEKYNSNVITFTSHQQADDYITELKKSTSPDLTLKTENGYFNHRVAAVIVNDNKLLAQKNIKDNLYYLDSIMLYPQFIKNEIKTIDNLKLIVTREN